MQSTARKSKMSLHAINGYLGNETRPAVQENDFFLLNAAKWLADSSDEPPPSGTPPILASSSDFPNPIQPLLMLTPAHHF